MKKFKLYKQNQLYTELVFQNEQAVYEYLDIITRYKTYGELLFEDKTEVIPAVLDENGNVVQEEQTIIHPATHTYEIIDITEEVNREQALQKRMQLRQAGERLIDEMSVKNGKMGLSLTQLKALMLDEDAILVRELLWTGSLESTKAVIEEKRSKFEAMMGVEYVEWLVGKIDSILSSA